MVLHALIAGVSVGLFTVISVMVSQALATSIIPLYYFPSLVYC